MGKVSIFQKPTIYGGQVVQFNPDKMDVIGISSDKDIESKIKEEVSRGYSVFLYGTSGDYVAYKSDEKDGLVRDVGKYIEENGFNKNIRLNPYELSQSKWEKNVDEWFSAALDDDDFKAEINSLCECTLGVEPKSRGNEPSKRFNAREELNKLYMWLRKQTGGYGKNGRQIEVSEGSIFLKNPDKIVGISPGKRKECVMTYIKKNLSSSVHRYMYGNNRKYRDWFWRMKKARKGAVSPSDFIN